ncbi:hypothetical protein [Achromobacter phage ewik_TL4]|nr:hypothetical protein Axy06_045 [Achromobacter phage vB_AxyS_19-32_Axy06]QDH84308.1 hypothetical protein Axy16_048 [Achromobacter phage vB_AxyS_19-32_Axy16]QIW86471.1 hypothetical protein AMA1_43 [Achromobacter phage AMA1]WNO48561.1 hypothetical protein [Achromobacter phage hasilly_LB3]WNO48757.1 hypothetical protein [Achromobacter phage nyaak_TL1]WNO48823.1 hypothetical protein [Achromobacter phage maay_LB1]WNO48886.1 hypothetical protein [Achromobacter phage kuwaak_TL2]WNO48951.1 hypothe
MAMVKCVTPVGRVSFPSVFAASSYEGSAPKFSLMLVFEPEKFTDNEKKLWAQMLKLGDDAAVSKFKKKMDALPGNFKKPIRDGEEKENLAGFGPGKKFITFSSKHRPGIVDRNGNPIEPIVDQETGKIDLQASGELFYPGCYARVTMTAYAYDNVGKGVAFGLQNIQFIANGERLDNKVDAASDFAGMGEAEFEGAAEPGGDFE